MYKAYEAASKWMGVHERRDMGKALGGALGEGMYNCLQVVSRVRSDLGSDMWVITFRDTSWDRHSEHMRGRAAARFVPGKVFAARIVHDGTGYRIERGSDGKFYLWGTSGREVASSTDIRELYRKVYGRGQKLAGLRISWCREI